MSICRALGSPGHAGPYRRTNPCAPTAGQPVGPRVRYHIRRVYIIYAAHCCARPLAEFTQCAFPPCMVANCPQPCLTVGRVHPHGGWHGCPCGAVSGAGADIPDAHDIRESAETVQHWHIRGRCALLVAAARRRSCSLGGRPLGNMRVPVHVSW